MALRWQDVVSVAALSTGYAPPIVNHKEHDPVLGYLRLCQGEGHDCRFALHFAAGFGSQIAYVLYHRPG